MINRDPSYDVVVNINILINNQDVFRPMRCQELGLEKSDNSKT